MEHVNNPARSPASGSALPEPVARLVRLVATVYEHADPDLRRGVRDTLQAGIPASVLTQDLARQPLIDPQGC